MARRGATVVGIDNSTGQLATAGRLAADHGVALTLIHGNAETVPYPDGSFDFAVSEDGAAIWCDPYVWIPEAHRLLRPGGTLVFLGTSTWRRCAHPWTARCRPPSGSRATISRSTASTSRDAVDEPGGIEFNLPLSRWFRLFREMGFDVFDFLEWWSLHLVDRRRHHRAMPTADTQPATPPPVDVLR